MIFLYIKHLIVGIVYALLLPIIVGGISRDKYIGN